MPQPARSQSQEFWRPANPATARIARPILAPTLCSGCGADYAPAARFCHVCGNERNPRVAAPPSLLTFADLFDVSVIRQRFGLSVPSLLFFIAGIVCVVVALGIGLFHKSGNFVEWQAVQLWRVELLLGASAAMLAGVILRK